MSIVGTIVSGISVAALVGMWTMFRRFIKEQRTANSLNRDSIRSIQRAEIIRYFRLVVEEQQPVSTEEMEHIEACYNAYHNSGGNGTGTLMYEKIRENARIVTKIG